MKKCNFCAEEIKDEAVKCKHCGSDLRKSGSLSPNASDNARSYIKAIKDKELHDTHYGLSVFVALVTSISLGILSGHYLGTGLGVLTFIVTTIICLIPATKRYYKE